MVESRGDRESRLKRERRQALIQRLNADDEYLQSLEGRRRETGQLSEEELALEIERQRNLSRRGYGGGSLS